MIPYTSDVNKLVIFATASDVDPELIEEVVVLVMKGVKVTNVYIAGRAIDESNIEGIIEDILNEESDSRFIDARATEFQFKNISGHNSLFGDYISEIVLYHDRKDSLDYVVYNSENASDDLYDDLYDFMLDVDDTLTPTNFKDVYTYDSDILNLINKFGIKDHMYSRDSSLMGALYTGILFDISLGK